MTRKATIETMQELAASRGGSCLSDTYIDGETLMHWECKRGHKFWNTSKHIKNGTWCPDCPSVDPDNQIVIGSFPLEVLVPDHAWRSGKFYIFTREYAAKIIKMRYSDAITAGISRSIFFALKSQDPLSNYIAIIPSAEVLYNMPVFKAEKKGNEFWIAEEDAKKLEIWRNGFEESKSTIFSKIIEINSNVPQMTARSWLVWNVKPHILEYEKNYDRNFDLEELIPNILWRYSSHYIVTQNHWEQIRNLTEKEALRIGISKFQLKHWKKLTRPSKKVIQVPNAEFMRSIPKIEIFQNKMRVYVKTSEWEKMRKFRDSSPITSHNIFSRIIASICNTQDHIIAEWLYKGHTPRLTPDYNYDEIFNLATKVSNPLTRQFCALLGFMLIAGNLQTPGTPTYRTKIEDGSILYHEELMPTTVGTTINIVDNEKAMMFYSLDPYFIQYLDKSGILTWNDTATGRIQLTKEFIASLEKQNRLILISNVFCRRLSLETNKYIKISIPIMKKSWSYIQSIIDMFCTADLTPALINYRTDGEERFEEQLISYCEAKRIEYHKVEDQGFNTIYLSYGPLGSKLIPDYKFDNNSRTLQYIIENILPNGFIRERFAEKVIKAVAYYNEKYARISKLPTCIEFRKALDENGGLDAQKLELMSRCRVQTKNLTYCKPIWKLLDDKTIIPKTINPIPIQ